MSEKHYPRDESALVDNHVEAPAKPCAKRITHENVCRFESKVTWCTQPEGHDGQCSGPLPSILPRNDLGPAASRRRRW